MIKETPRINLGVKYGMIHRTFIQGGILPCGDGFSPYLIRVDQLDFEDYEPRITQLSGRFQLESDLNLKWPSLDQVDPGIYW